MLPLSALITAFAQLGVLLVLPAAWWALTARRSLGFAAWIGLRAPQWHGGWVRAVVAGLAWALASVASVVLLRSTSEGTAVSGFAGTGLAQSCSTPSSKRHCRRRFSSADSWGND